MRKLLSVIVSLMTAMTFAQQPVELPLWPNGAPNSNGLTGGEKEVSPHRLSNVTAPTITVYRAPQPNGMAVIMCPGGGYSRLAMDHEGHDMAPWLLYGIGAVLAIVLTFFKIPALAFALGMFIPLELNVPLVVGGAVNWFVTTRSKDASLNTERGEKGTLLASGFIAGGALMGVISAAMRFGGINLVNEAWLNNTWSEVLALGAYALLILYFIKASMKVK